MSEKLPEYVFHQFDYLFDKMDGAYFGEAEIAGILYGVKQDGTYPGADYVYRYIQRLQIRLREEKERTLHEKYKRCLKVARWCFTKANYHFYLARSGEDGKENMRKDALYTKWRRRWIELADKFKEAKCR